MAVKMERKRERGGDRGYRHQIADERFDDHP